MVTAVRRKCGFVSLDVLWIVILFALVIVLSVRGIGLVEKRDNADRLKRELELVSEAVQQLAEDEGLEAGEVVAFSRYSPYLQDRAPKRLREAGEDPLGGEYGEQIVGAEAVPDPATAEALGEFWK